MPVYHNTDSLAETSLYRLVKHDLAIKRTRQAVAGSIAGSSA